MSRFISIGLLIAVIAILSILFFKILVNFLVPLFLAALLVVIFRPMHEWVLNLVGGREKIAAFLTTAGILTLVLLPFAILTVLAISEGRDLVRNFNPRGMANKVEALRTSFKLDLPVASELRRIDDAFNRITDSRSIYDSNIHQESWYEIQEQLKVAAGKLKRPFEPQPLPEELEDGEQPLDVDPWQRLVDLQYASYRMEYDTSQLPETDGEQQEAKNRAWQEYNELLDVTREAYTDVRNEVTGGRPWSTLKMLANPDSEQVQQYSGEFSGYLQDQLVNLGSRTGAFLISVLVGGSIMVVALYFFLLDGPKMMETLHGLFPMDDAHERELVQEFNNVSRAVVVATLLSALAQGVLAGIGFYFCGLHSIFLLTLLTCGLAMVPFIGAAAVWVPCALYLYLFEGNLTAAIGLAIYGAVVVSMADNFIKPYILHGKSNLHPLLALLSVLGGVAALGPIGLLIGPMVVVFLQTLLKILRREMQTMDSENQLATAAGVNVTVEPDPSPPSTDEKKTAVTSTEESPVNNNGDAEKTDSGSGKENASGKSAAPDASASAGKKKRKRSKKS